MLACRLVVLENFAAGGASFLWELSLYVPPSRRNGLRNGRSHANFFVASCCLPAIVCRTACKRRERPHQANPFRKLTLCHLASVGKQGSGASISGGTMLNVLAFRHFFMSYVSGGAQASGVSSLGKAMPIFLAFRTFVMTCLSSGAPSSEASKAGDPCHCFLASKLLCANAFLVAHRRLERQN